MSSPPDAPPLAIRKIGMFAKFEAFEIDLIPWRLRKVDPSESHLHVVVVRITPPYVPLDRALCRKVEKENRNFWMEVRWQPHPLTGTRWPYLISRRSEALIGAGKSVSDQASAFEGFKHAELLFPLQIRDSHKSVLCYHNLAFVGVEPTLNEYTL